MCCAISLCMQVIPTALTRLRWWRVCLDEAQMVDNPSSPVSAMAAHLRAVHRWAITGTPMSHGLGDMRGLLTFLRAAPLCNLSARLLSAIGQPRHPLHMFRCHTQQMRWQHYD